MIRAALAAATLLAVLAVLAPGGRPAGALGAPVPDTVIDFEQDASGIYPNPAGLTSRDSPFVHFTEVRPDKYVELGGFVETNGARGLVSPGDGFDGIRILLDRPTNRITMRFGNDKVAFTEPGDGATLTAYRGSTQVGQTRVVMNRNDVADQSIGFRNGPLFNRVVIRYSVAFTSVAIDDIRIGPLCTKAGTEAAETLIGTPGNDVICGGGGNDTIFGRGGRDHIIGGTGADTLNGEDGEDFVAGNFGNDVIHGGNQNDRVEGGEQNDKVFGDAGNDFVSGGPGTDTCNGGPGTDTTSACEGAGQPAGKSPSGTSSAVTSRSA